MDFRIQKRKRASNIIEMRVVNEGKEKWIPYIAPLCNKQDGDVVANLLLGFLNEQNYD